MDTVDKVIAGITALGAIAVGTLLIYSVVYPSALPVLGAIGALALWVIAIKLVLFWCD